MQQAEPSFTQSFSGSGSFSRGASVDTSEPPAGVTPARRDDSLDVGFPPVTLPNGDVILTPSDTLQMIAAARRLAAGPAAGVEFCEQFVLQQLRLQRRHPLPGYTCSLFVYGKRPDDLDSLEAAGSRSYIVAFIKAELEQTREPLTTARMPATTATTAKGTQAAAQLDEALSRARPSQHPLLLRAIKEALPPQPFERPASSMTLPSSGAPPVAPAAGSVLRALVRFSAAITLDRGTALIDDLKQIAVQRAAAAAQVAAASTSPAAKGSSSSIDESLDSETLLALLESVFPEGAVEQITDMGFSERSARRALLRNRMDIERATNAILLGSVSDEPLSEKEVRDAAQVYLSDAAGEPAAAASSAGAGGSKPASSSSGTTTAMTGREGSGERGENEWRLISMGFDAIAARAALRVANNDFVTACNMLVEGDVRLAHAHQEMAAVSRLSQPFRDDPALPVEAAIAFSVCVTTEPPAAALKMINDPATRPSVLALLSTFG